MTTALVCVDGYRTASLLDAAGQSLAPPIEWLVLHVVDTRPATGLDIAASRLPGRGAERHHAVEQMYDLSAEETTIVRREVEGWLAERTKPAELLQARGRPEREIVAVAEERSVDLIVLGGGRGLAGHYPGPGRHPLSPVARYVIDHARCDVLLLRRYVATADRRR